MNCDCCYGSWKIRSAFKTSYRQVSPLKKHLLWSTVSPLILEIVLCSSITSNEGWNIFSENGTMVLQLSIHYYTIIHTALATRVSKKRYQSGRFTFSHPFAYIIINKMHIWIFQLLNWIFIFIFAFSNSFVCNRIQNMYFSKCGTVPQLNKLYAMVIFIKKLTQKCIWYVLVERKVNNILKWISGWRGKKRDNKGRIWDEQMLSFFISDC